MNILPKYWTTICKKAPHFLRVNTEVTSLLRAVEKYFGCNADYAKGSGSTFDHHMRIYHPNTYLYPVARTNGGNHQDIGTEGAIPVLMNVAYYLEFLNIKLATTGGSILEQNLATLLGSVEVIALLRVLSILHVAVTVPT